MSNSDGIQPDWTQGYGYQFWRCRHNAYRGDGVFGQYCIVMPDQDAVLAITSGVDIFDMQHPLNLVWEHLLSAMHPDPLPDDLAAYDSLSKKLDSLTLMPVQGSADSPTASQVSGRTYGVDRNEYDIETIQFDFAASGCTITLKTPTGEDVIPCGFGSWQHGGGTALFRQAILFDRTPMTTSGAWTAEDVLTLIVRLYETPFYHTMVCHFMGDDLLIEIRINVSLESLQPVLLLASEIKGFGSNTHPMSGSPLH